MSDMNLMPELTLDPNAAEAVPTLTLEPELDTPATPAAPVVEPAKPEVEPVVCFCFARRRFIYVYRINLNVIICLCR